MRIGQHDSSDSKRRLKPPPDYSSRRMQWRLLGIVSLLMVVLWAAFEARKPETWKWFTTLEKRSNSSEPDIDPRLTAPAEAEQDAEETIVGEPLTSHKLPPIEESEADSAVERAWLEGWWEVFNKLSYSERTVIYDLLRSAREKVSLEEAKRQIANETIASLDQHWSDYRAVASNSVADLTAEEQAAWAPVLEELELRWTVHHKPLLMIVAQGESLDDEQRSQLFALQDLIDRQQLKGIMDNTPWRASDREIWFRMLGKLQQRTPQELEQSSEGRVSYAQLFKQPDAYRGKVVTVRGTAQAIYSAKAPANSYGIKQYWVYWLQPEGGPNSPILVYALEKPESLPSMQESELGRRKLSPMPDVVFNGFFFKKYAYQGKGGLYTAPLMLARVPVPIEGAFSERRELPNAATFLAVAAGLALLAAALAFWVYQQYRPGRSPDREHLPDRIVIKG